MRPIYIEKVSKVIMVSSRSGCILIFTSLLAACETLTSAPPPAPPLAQPPPAPDLALTQQQNLAPAPSFADELLKRAEAHMNAGRLLSPEEDNAYINFRAAQILDPNSAQARAGLNAILINEFNSARDQLARQRLSAAEQRYRQLQRLFPDAELIKILDAEIASARKVLQARVATRKREQPVENSANFKRIDERGLRKHSDAVVQQLQQLASELRETHQSVLIYAPSDALGRWMYQQMREAVPDYRIRGDIRIGAPGIRLLEPLD